MVPNGESAKSNRRIVGTESVDEHDEKTKSSTFHQTSPSLSINVGKARNFSEERIKLKARVAWSKAEVAAELWTQIEMQYLPLRLLSVRDSDGSKVDTQSIDADARNSSSRPSAEDVSTTGIRDVLPRSLYRSEVLAKSL
jgi:hypothetical protein